MRLVPILEFVHELQAAGVRASAREVVDRPEEHWHRLDPEAQALFLAKRGLDAAPGTRVSLQVVKRRGRAPLAENVFVRVEAGEAPRAGRLGWSRFLFRPLASAEDPDLEQFEVTPSILQRAGFERSSGALLRLLDRLWGEGAYDPKTEGPFASYKPISEFEEVERYWADEPFCLIVLLRDREHELVYHIEEPPLSALEKALLVTVNDRLRDALILDERLDVEDRAALLVGKAFDLLRMYRFRADRRTAYKLGYYFARNYLGFGPIDPLMRDPNIEDVSCNGPSLPLFIAHSRHQTVRTSIVFEELELNSLTLKLAQRGGKMLSLAQPLVDATLPDGSRIQACLGREVTSRGSAFTIRKFREDPLTCVDLIRGGTHSLDTMAFLWLVVELRKSLIVMGSTASGKTTTLNVLSQFIPPSLKIVTLEDTREVTLQHENWLAGVTRETTAGSEADRISMFDLLRSALRQRPEYILVGEIRGEEGLTLFQAMSTGHTCFSSMHAGSVENAVYRLENEPIRVPRVMLSALDFFLLQGQVDYRGKLVRRMLSLTEIDGIDPQSKNLRTNDIFSWDAGGDAHVPVSTSHVLDDARARRGWTRSRLDEELAARRRVLERLLHANERHYRDVARAVRRFYATRTEPEGPPAVTTLTPSGAAATTQPQEKPRRRGA